MSVMREREEPARATGMGNTEDSEEDLVENGFGAGEGRNSKGQIDDQAKTRAVYNKLEHHPVFKQAGVDGTFVFRKDNSEGWRPRISIKLIAYDGLGRLFVWDSKRKQLHYVEILRSDSLRIGSDPDALLASRKFQTVQLSSPVDFPVLHLAFNRTGRSLVLVGDEALVVLNPIAPSSAAATGLCRVQKVGSEQIFCAGDGLWLRILQIGWHPHSDTHLGVLSSDGCFRFDSLASTNQRHYLAIFGSKWATWLILRPIDLVTSVIPLSTRLCTSATKFAVSFRVSKLEGFGIVRSRELWNAVEGQVHYSVSLLSLPPSLYFEIRSLVEICFPYSRTDGSILDFCRLFDLSLNAECAEQEYYLQPRLSARCGSASFIRASSFAFGGEHLWDRFTVFVLYNDGSVFALCPVVPFGSMYNSSVIDELAKDARQLELRENSPRASVESARLALSWLEAVFPGLYTLSDTLTQELSGISFLLKAHAHVPLDASLLLQGPFSTLCRGAGDEENLRYLEERNDVTGQAVGLLCNVVGKDSVLAISTRDGQVQIYVLADEVQPAWDIGKPPQLTVDDKGHILAVGMLVNSSSVDVVQLEGKVEDFCESLWPGRIPPLLQLAVVDLALEPGVVDVGPVVLLADPVVPERLYCQHAAGLDVILVQWLPFSVQNATKISSEGPSPAVFPVLDIYTSVSTISQPLLGVTLVLDSLGESWVVAVTANCECAVINMKPHRTLPEPLVLGGNGNEEQDPGYLEVGVFQMMSKELLHGPKDIPFTKLTTLGVPLTLETIEGRTFLHDQCKLLREKYIEYSHRVYVELVSHGSRLCDIVKEQQHLVENAEAKLRHSQRETSSLVSRIKLAVQKNRNLEQRVRQCSTLPCVSEKPFTQSESKFKIQLDTMRLQDLDILNCAVEVLSVRSQRSLGAQIESSQLSSFNSPSGVKKVGVPDSQMQRLKHAIEHLGLFVKDSFMKVKMIDESVGHWELLKDR